MENIAQSIREKILRENFDVIGFAEPQIQKEAKLRLRKFLKRGFHGEMNWIPQKQKRLENPKNVWSVARSVITLGIRYGSGQNPQEDLKKKEIGNISIYARGEDYHDVLKKKLKRIAGWIVETFGGQVKVFVDTAPILEKHLAEQAGIGWQGKHSNLVSRSLGSWFFLGEIFTTIPLPTDKPESDHCGTCQSCLDICPTNAFPKPYVLDATKCISYLTIEYKGHIPKKFRSAMGNRIYGCDDCLAVCPWNRFAQKTSEIGFKARKALLHPDLKMLMKLSDSQFRKFFTKSPIKRIGRNRFIRNVIIAAANSKKKYLMNPVKELIRDDSSLIRAMAVWALQQLSEKKEFLHLKKQYISKETNIAVKSEWE